MIGFDQLGSSDERQYKWKDKVRQKGSERRERESLQEVRQRKRKIDRQKRLERKTERGASSQHLSRSSLHGLPTHVSSLDRVTQLRKESCVRGKSANRYSVDWIELCVTVTAVLIPGSDDKTIKKGPQHELMLLSFSSCYVSLFSRQHVYR